MRNDQPEHRLQHHCIALCDRLILTDGPSWWTGVDHSVKMTNAAPQAKMNYENHRRWMGVAPHHLDLYIYQFPLFAQIELKFAGTQMAAERALTTGQRDTMAALDRRRVQHGYAWSIRSFYEVLCRIGFNLHPNAKNIVREVEEGYAAAQDLVEIKRAAPAKPRTYRPASSKPSKAHLRKVAQGTWF